MGNQIIIMLVIGSLLGLFGGNAITKLNPFNSSGKVAVAKQESQKEEYFKDKVKGIEYKMTEKAKGQTPAKRSMGSWVGNFVDNFFKAIVTFIIIGFVILFMTGINVFKLVIRLRKALRQTVAGIQEAKGTMNGEEAKLRASLKDKHDEETELLVKQIKLGK